MSAPRTLPTGGTLRGRRALVTGATGGIGGAVAAALAREGCALVLSGRDEARLATAAEALAPCTPGGRVHWCPADLAAASDVEALADRAQRALDGIDVLANCAGVFPIGALDAVTDAEFDRCLAVNVRAPFQLTRALAPAMASRGWGRIVNVGSSSAYAGFARTALYCASKHALLGLTRATHAEYRARGVRAYSVSPGSVKTAMGRDVPDQEWNTFLEPGEVAAYVAFVIGFDSNLVSEEVRLNRVLGPS